MSRFPAAPSPTCPKWLPLLPSLLLAALWPLSAAALKTDAQQPIEVQAQRGEAATREGISRLSGGVDIKQGSMHARADNAEIQQAKDGGIAKVTLTGTPATLKQTLDDGRLMDAQARTVRYDVAAGIVVLEGGALVTRGADRMQGEQITYQPDNGMMNAEGTSDKPVIFTLQPTARAAATTPDSATPAPTPPPAPEKPADGER